MLLLLLGPPVELKFQDVPAIYLVLIIGAPPVFLNRLIELSSLLLFCVEYCC